VVFGTDGRRVEGLRAETEMSVADVAGYGADNIGELLTQITADVDGTEEGPVILVNGKPANGVNSVNDLPSEAVDSVQVLPPEAATALGYEPTRRVINIVLKRNFRQGQANGQVRGATAGRGFSSNANIGMVKVDGDLTRNFSLRVAKTEPLLESHRDIESRLAGMPYDLVGNVVSWPTGSGEIDPDLSALAGAPVTVLGLPGWLSTPTLEAMLPGANQANFSDVGRYRTLVADQYTIGVNGNMSFRLSESNTLNLNVSGERGESVSRNGAPTALLQVPASSPYSPFSQDVGVARYLGAPLRQENEPVNASFGANLNSQLGRWRVQANLNYAYRGSDSVTDRRVDTTALQAAIDAGTVNPFAPLPADMLNTVLVDNARTRGHNTSLRLQASGRVAELPAGNATLSVRTQIRDNRQRARTTGTNLRDTHRKQREEQVFTSLNLPLYRRAPESFRIGSELSASMRDVSVVGTLYNYGYGLNWGYGNRLTMRFSLNHEKVAPQPDALTNPIVTVDDYRAYDFVRQETVLVRYITGGNPDLKVERRRFARMDFTLRPFQDVDFMINGEYRRVIGRNAVSGLPAVSEDVQLAFPDRYRRDDEGRLVEIDARLVSFERTETERVRWGGNLRRNFGGAQGDNASGWRLNANFTHTWQLSNKRLARAGLPEQDLLAGGTGTGNGQSRHDFQSRIGLSRNGIGMQTRINWKGRATIIAGTTADPNTIVFSPLLRLDVSAFANLDSLLPQSAMARGTRITLGVDNVLDAKQRVRDETGATPLRYQPYLLNALGRTVSLSLRKAF
jgi:iron complex outermembrane receptor protein